MAKLQEDVRRFRFWRALTAEFLGTLFLVLIGCGAWTELDTKEHLFTVKVALAFGMTYMAVLYCLRSLGDPHINPAVTMAMLATRRTSVVRAVLFITSQMLGAILGAAFVRAVTSGHERNALGCNKPAEHVNDGQGFGVEFFATFFFVFVVFACYDKTSRRPAGEELVTSRDGAGGGAKIIRAPLDEAGTIVPFVIGLTYTAVLLFAIPYTGGSVNTARSFGPALINGVWNSHWIFWFGPLVGGVAGGGVYDLIFSTKATYKRLKACLFVFHRRDEPASPGDETTRGGGVEYSPERQGAFSDKEGYHGEHGDTVLDVTDGVEEAPTYPPPEPPRGGVGGGGDRSVLEDSSNRKSRLKLFRPKFSCFGDKHHEVSTQASLYPPPPHDSAAHEGEGGEGGLGGGGLGGGEDPKTTPSPPGQTNEY